MSDILAYGLIVQLQRSLHTNARIDIPMIMAALCNRASHYWATVCKTVRHMLSGRCLSVLSVTLVYCGQTVGWIKMKLGMQVGLVPGHTAIGGDTAPLPQRGTAPVVAGYPSPHVQKSSSRFSCFCAYAPAAIT